MDGQHDCISGSAQPTVVTLEACPHCIITLVGSDPAVRPLLLDQAQTQAMLDQRLRRLM